MEAFDVYEPIMLCASCAKRYRDAKYDVLPVYDDKTTGECTLCRRWCGKAYVIDREKILQAR